MFHYHCIKPTKDIDEPEKLAEEVSVGPEVVVLEVGVEVVQQQLLLLSLLRFSKHTDFPLHMYIDLLYALNLFS